MESIYENNIKVIIEKIKIRQTLDTNKKTKNLEAKIRKIFFNLTGIRPEIPLLSYGEQPDPPIVKNTGKSILAEILKNRLAEEGIIAININDYLPDDVFGSNAQVFKNLNLLSGTQAEIFGKQTYARAPATLEYRSALRNILIKSAPLEKRSILENLDDSAFKEIGPLNYFYRTEIENNILPFKIKRYSLSALEKELAKDQELLEEILPYSGLVGKLGQGFFVIWKGKVEEKLKSKDSGYRRYFVKLQANKFQVVSPFENSQIFFEGPLESLFSHENFSGISFDASSRAVICYLLSNNGCNITGGGSLYNETVAKVYTEQAFPKPIIAHLSLNNGLFPLSALIGKEDKIKSLLEDSIDSTDSSKFSKVLDGGQ